MRMSFSRKRVCGHAHNNTSVVFKYAKGIILIDPALSVIGKLCNTLCNTDVCNPQQLLHARTYIIAKTYSPILGPYAKSKCLKEDMTSKPLDT